MIRPLYSVRLVRDGGVPSYGRVRTSDDVVRLFQPLLHEEPGEVFLVIGMSAKGDMLGAHVASRGILNSALIEPREVFRFAIVANAASVILIHNHPSGDPTPSQEDLLMTGRMLRAADIMGIPIFDHIIISSAGASVSMQENGLLRHSDS